MPRKEGKILLYLEPEKKEEIKKGCEKLGTSMTSLICEAALKEVRNRLHLMKSYHAFTTTNYSNR